MNPTPYLVFQGICREAMNTYADIFGGTIEMMVTGAEMPGMDLPDDKAGQIMHSQLAFDGGRLMASDDMMGSNPVMAGCWVMMELADSSAARAAFDRLAAGGEVTMPFAPTAWSEGFGALNDRFGTRWMITCPGTAPGTTPDHGQ